MINPLVQYDYFNIVWISSNLDLKLLFRWRFWWI